MSKCKPILSNSDLVKLFYKTVLDKRPTRFCEVGAFNAQASQHIAKNLPACSITAFEADPTNYEKYSKTMPKRVEYVHRAISNVNELATFFVQNVSKKGGTLSINT